eukprot:CAMPEP_0206373582 /NCGR_PEP_ID=MMETSP0294-20121207/7803_1 /ASSEMBLY_ACC=CAM_ASM_000327 /TAXON_ID=39354 /ORGANISM="Heterosigma akashiwo, Strain CCMP2393" /LENGTH=593 /DNA_ID=CAMNT_0053821205 /DNA_START=16 /DNA_END=1797 /DNA_ORIENTATION=+
MTDEERQRQEASKNARMYTGTLIFMSLTQMLLMADSSLMGPTLSNIASEFNMTDDERDEKLGGEIPFAYFIVGGTISLWVGSLADTMPRLKLFFIIVLLGEIPGILVYFCSSFWQLFLLRVCPGVSVGGALPVVLSVVADVFPPERRALATAGVFLTTTVGLGLGEAVAGGLAGRYGWRIPFVVIALPAIICGTFVRFCGIEPPRKIPVQEDISLTGSGSSSSHHGPPALSWEKVRRVLDIRTNWWVLAQGIPGCLPWGTIFTFLADDLQARGLSQPAAGGLLSVFSAGMALGTLAGGALGQLLYNARKELIAFLMSISTMLGIPPLLYLINKDFHSVDGGEGEIGFLSAVLAFFGGLMATMTGPNTRAVLMNVNPPDICGFVFGLCTISDDLGRGLGPPIVSGLVLLSDRAIAFNISALGWLGCGVFLMLVATTIREDEDAAAAYTAAATRGVTREQTGADGKNSTVLQSEEARLEEAQLAAGGGSRKKKKEGYSIVPASGEDDRPQQYYSSGLSPSEEHSPSPLPCPNRILALAKRNLEVHSSIGEGVYVPLRSMSASDKEEYNNEEEEEKKMAAEKKLVTKNITICKNNK